MPRVMNICTRPSSKIAVRFSKQMNVEWRDRMADFVQTTWLARQSPALREVLAHRENTLGYAQAHPFWCTEYTDDFWDVTPETTLTAQGAFIRALDPRWLRRHINVGESIGAAVNRVWPLCPASLGRAELL
ncbi:hypothetical protein AB1Y20_018050 [Prymnesium parvum]|uniref:Uncharacterized protein n=1 Tax=Prymnesium parvum TaxID=97485 RepID=A0AB34JQ62_PRYPA